MEDEKNLAFGSLESELQAKLAQFICCKNKEDDIKGIVLQS